MLRKLLGKLQQIQKEMKKKFKLPEKLLILSKMSERHSLRRVQFIQTHSIHLPESLLVLILEDLDLWIKTHPKFLLITQGDSIKILRLQKNEKSIQIWDVSADWKESLLKRKETHHGDWEVICEESLAKRNPTGSVQKNKIKSPQNNYGW